MGAGEWVFLFIVLALLGGMLIWVFRYSNWITDRPDEPPPTTVLPNVPGPKPVAGWEWVGLQAHDALSLIPPDREGTYIVRINDDNTFSVRYNRGPDG